MENLPPVTAQHAFLRIGNLPTFLVLEIDGGFLVVGCGNCGWSRSLVLGPHIATGNECERQTGASQNCQMNAGRSFSHSHRSLKFTTWPLAVQRAEHRASSPGPAGASDPW